MWNREKRGNLAQSYETNSQNKYLIQDILLPCCLSQNRSISLSIQKHQMITSSTLILKTLVKVDTWTKPQNASLHAVELIIPIYCTLLSHRCVSESLTYSNQLIVRATKNLNVNCVDLIIFLTSLKSPFQFTVLSMSADTIRAENAQSFQKKSILLAISLSWGVMGYNFILHMSVLTALHGSQCLWVVCEAVHFSILDRLMPCLYCPD